VFSQTLQAFEIIITDDSDNDEVYQALAPWHEDTRLVYRRNETQLGSPENWNAAMALARSGLIKFLHHDDWFAEADALERFVRALETNPEMDFAFSAAKACEDDGRVIFIHRPQQTQIDLLREQPWALQFANFIGAPSATIFRTSASLKFNINLRWVVDIDAYLRILGEQPKFEYISDELVCIASNGAHQVTRSVALNTVARVEEHIFLYAHNPPRKLMGRVDGFLYLCRLLTACNLSELNSIETRERSQHSYRFEKKMALITVKFKMKLLKLKGKLQRKLAEIRFRRNNDARVSYSQCGEDMIVDFLFMWLGKNKISYLDIGAHHPTWLSNTYSLYKKGQRGILIEPDDDLCQYIRQKRPRDQVLNLAVNTEGDDMMNLYVMTSRTLNTMDKEQALALEKAGREQIECVREVRRLGINKDRKSVV
jgi:glycosyltransferase involved in cell wall biosynthesis